MLQSFRVDPGIRSSRRTKALFVLQILCCGFVESSANQIQRSAASTARTNSGSSGFTLESNRAITLPS